MTIELQVGWRQLAVGLAVLVGAVTLMVWWSSPARSQGAGPPVVDTFAFVARADNPVDALAASSAAGQLGAPVYVTFPDGLDEQAAEGLKATDPQVVVLAGGTSDVGIDWTLTVNNVDVGGQLTALSARIDSLESDLSAANGRIDALESTLARVSRSGDTLTFSAMNVAIVNGQGATATTNGLGNLIVGHNEDHTYSSYAGFVAGQNNTISGQFASVSGGRFNTGSGTLASVSGGSSNAAGFFTTVAGGLSGTIADVSGNEWDSLIGNSVFADG